jgi:hypothetical protein
MPLVFAPSPALGGSGNHLIYLDQMLDAASEVTGRAMTVRSAWELSMVLL